MTVTPGDSRPGRSEWIALAVLCIAFIAINVATATWYPAAWGDEAMYTDPAVNLWRGHGFTSTAWPQQTSTEFWAGNTPLHQVLLAGWLKVFGFSICVVRSMNYLLMVGAALALWWGAFRLRLVRTGWARLLLIGLLFTGYGIAFSFRSGRRDAIAVLLMCLTPLAYSIERDRYRQAAFAGLGVLLALAGLELLAYLCVLTMLVTLFLGWPFLKKVLPLLVATGFGFAALVGFYFLKGVGMAFLVSTVGFQNTLTGDLAQSVAFQNQNFLSRFAGRLVKNQWGNVYYQDPSFLLLMAVCALGVVWSLTRRSREWRSIEQFGLLTALALPVTMFVIGRYPLYYSWMAFVPVAVASCRVGERLDAGFSRCAGVFLLVGALLVGLPTQLAQAAGGRFGQYAAIEDFARRTLGPNDRVYGDGAVYYVARQRAAEYYFLTYASGKLQHGIPENERRAITVLVVSPDEFTEAVKKIGGQWTPTGEVIESGHTWERGPHDLRCGYDLRVYRRKETP